MGDHEAGPEYKVFVGGISWQMDDQALMKGRAATSPLSTRVWQYLCAGTGVNDLKVPTTYVLWFNSEAHSCSCSWLAPYMGNPASPACFGSLLLDTTSSTHPCSSASQPYTRTSTDPLVDKADCPISTSWLSIPREHLCFLQSLSIMEQPRLRL